MTRLEREIKHFQHVLDVAANDPDPNMWPVTYEKLVTTLHEAEDKARQGDKAATRTAAAITRVLNENQPKYELELEVRHFQDMLDKAADNPDPHAWWRAFDGLIGSLNEAKERARQGDRTAARTAAAIAHVLNENQPEYEPGTMRAMLQPDYEYDIRNDPAFRAYAHAAGRGHEHERDRDEGLER